PRRRLDRAALVALLGAAARGALPRAPADRPRDRERREQDDHQSEQEVALVLLDLLPHPGHERLRAETSGETRQDSGGFTPPPPQARWWVSLARSAACGARDGGARAAFSSSGRLHPHSSSKSALRTPSRAPIRSGKHSLGTDRAGETARAVRPCGQTDPVPNRPVTW